MLNPLIIKECGSGLNAKRKNIQRLIKMVMNDEVRNIYITYPDRLTRFGYEYLETAFAEHGTRIISVSEDIDDKTADEELLDDMMALLASFSGRLYGMRSHKNMSEAKQRKAEQLAGICDDQAR